MDETAAPEPVHDLLLRLAGRVDDDLLADAREFVAVGEDGQALELVTAALAADATPLPGALRAGLVGAARAARIDLDVDAALGPVGDVGDDHRFTAEAGPVDAVQDALGTLPARRFEGCELRISWRLTPAGAASGPLPQPVVLVRAGGHGPPDVLAYQMATALGRGGVRASVEVLADGGPVPRYHAAAWRESAPLPLPPPDPPAAGDGPGPSSVHVHPDDRYDDERSRSAVDGRDGAPGNGHGSWSDVVPETGGRGAGTDRWSSWTDDRATARDDPGAGSAVSLFDDRGGRPVDPPKEPWGPSGGPPIGPDGDDGARPGNPRWTGAVDSSPGVGLVDDDVATDPRGREPAPRPLPMRPPGGRRRLVEQPGDTHHGVTPLNRGPSHGPTPIDRRRPSPRPMALPQVVDPAEGSVPRPSRPDPAELSDTPTFAATHDALLGSESSSPGSGGPGPNPSGSASGRASGGAGPVPARAGAAAPTESVPATSARPAPAAPADEERAWGGEWTSGDWTVADPGPDQQTAAEPAGSAQAAGLLRPETVTRLSDSDRDLLARLQAELVAGRRPSSGHQGTNGAHAEAPPDRD